MRETDNVVSATRLVWILGRLAGLGYSFPGERIEKKPPTLYVHALKLLYVCLMFTTVVIMIFLTGFDLKTSSEHVMVDAVNAMFNLTTIVTVIVTTIFQLGRQNDLTTVVNDINEVDVKLKRFSRWRSYRKIKAISLIMALVWLMIMVASAVICWHMCSTTKCVHHWLMITTVQSIITINFMNFTVHMAVIWQKLCVINDNIKQISGDELSISISLFKEIGRIRAIKSMQIIYLEVLDISRRLNKIYDIFLILSILTQSISIFVFWYYFFFGFTLDDPFNQPRTLHHISNIIGVSQLLIICLICQFIVFQSRYTRKLMYQLPISRFNNTLLKKINQFSLRMAHQEFYITAHGFFNIDCTLPLTVVGAVAVYLVMFIQFDLASCNSKELLNLSKTNCGTADAKLSNES